MSLEISIATIADQRGTAVEFLARDPAVYEKYFAAARIPLAEITREILARAAAYERADEERIRERIRIFNENQILLRRGGDNCSDGKIKTTHNGESKMAVKVKRSEALAMFKGMNYSTCQGWDDKKLKEKIHSELPRADEEDHPSDAAQLKLLKKLQKALAADEEIAVESDDAAATAPAKRGRGRPPKNQPAASPSGSPSSSPSGSPATSPSGSPAASPSGSPAASGSPSGSPLPSGSPSATPASPAGSPSGSPSGSSPSGSPAASPSGSPSGKPQPAQSREEFVGIRELIIELRTLTAAVLVLTNIFQPRPAAKPEKDGANPGTPEPPAADDKSQTAVINEIARIMEKANKPERGLKSVEILDKLASKFDDRDEAWLKKKLATQLGGRLEAKFGLAVKKTRDGKYYTEKSS